uniref:Transmembrane 4 L six family member 19 n=1 Tax=Nothoprocta perdicaria TaxID=30464 RepID=A0A8C7A0J0_NOTPE
MDHSLIFLSPLPPRRAAMCVGKCTRILGPCLLTLGVLSIAANVLLLFPGWAWKYLADGHITKEAKAMPGVWGGGIIVFLSIVLSMLALLGSAASFIMSGVGLTNGPFCLYNTSSNELDYGPRWGYPFVDPNSQTFDSSLWSTCLEPVGIVTWNVCFFSMLLLISACEMVLTSLQIINGCFGSLCGFCDGK